MRRLIVNADDFGLTAGVNRAIAEGYTRGIITSTTLMANSAAFDDAVRVADELTPPAKRVPLSVGCHVVLADGEPLSAPGTIPSLLADGREFRRGVGELGLAAQLGRISEREIETEAEAQFAKLRSAGVEISHFDAHKHSHLFPAILRPLLRAAKAAGIRAVRNPFEPASPLPLAIVKRFGLWKRYAQVALLRSFRKSFLQAVRDSGLKTTEGSLGVVVTGDLNEELLRAILESMPEGTWELVCHPGYSDADLATVRTRLRASRETELSALTSPRIQSLLAERGIQLISFSEL